MNSKWLRPLVTAVSTMATSASVLRPFGRSQFTGRNLFIFITESTARGKEPDFRTSCSIQAGLLATMVTGTSSSDELPALLTSSRSRK